MEIVAGGLLLLTYLIIGVALVRGRRPMQADGRDQQMTEWGNEREEPGDDPEDDPEERPTFDNCSH